VAAEHSVSVALSPEADAALTDRARGAGHSRAREAEALIHRGLGVAAPERAPRRSAADVQPRLVRMAEERGGVTVVDVADELGVVRGVAQDWLRKARTGGLLTARRAGRRARGGSAPLVYTPTELGRRVASAA
jgi:transposase-like protein